MNYLGEEIEITVDEGVSRQLLKTTFSLETVSSNLQELRGAIITSTLNYAKEKQGLEETITKLEAKVKQMEKIIEQLEPKKEVTPETPG